LSQELKGYQLACALLWWRGSHWTALARQVSGVLWAVRDTRLQSRNADHKKASVTLHRLFGEERNNRKMVSLLLTHAVFCCVVTELICWHLESTCDVKLKKHF